MLLVVLLAAVAAVAAGVVALSPVELRDEVHTVPRPGVASQTSLTPPRAAMVPAADDGQAGRDPRSVPTSVPGEGSVGPGGAVFDDSSATVANLDPALLDALRTAATAALDDGVELHVNSGWRSAAEQERLLEQAVAEYGSVKEAETLGGHPGDVGARVRRCRRPRPVGGCALARAARRGLRAVPDLPERALALRAATGCRARRLPIACMPTPPRTHG